jgi:hypothetical protein
VILFVSKWTLTSSSSFYILIKFNRIDLFGDELPELKYAHDYYRMLENQISFNFIPKASEKSLKGFEFEFPKNVTYGQVQSS